MFLIVNVHQRGPNSTQLLIDRVLSPVVQGSRTVRIFVVLGLVRLHLSHLRRQFAIYSGKESR